MTKMLTTKINLNFLAKTNLKMKKEIFKFKIILKEK